ncbi:hypothetical protein [Micromonospora sp. KC207]|uniref:hypothetical protein n=1 Tax=Micromonospora sp. KC207 TaxID=2530377 RepID=UPI001404FE14|nr:hypothetical protein [Micromonospora sp. KC207]
MAIEPRRTVTSAHGPTTLERPWPEKAIGSAWPRPAAKAKATSDPLADLAPDEGV